MYDWVPLERVGPFVFGELVKPLVENGTLIRERDSMHETGWEYYSPQNCLDEIEVCTEDSRIVAIRCSQECRYQGANLIGLRLEELEKLLGEAPRSDPDTIVIDEEEQVVFEFEESEAQVWTKDSIIVAISCFARVLDG